MTDTTTPERGGLLRRVGLDRPELRAWAMYDWAVSAVQTTIMVAVFPIFFKTVAAADVPDVVATQHIATANSVAMLVIALLSPFLGALADYSAAATVLKKIGKTATMIVVCTAETAQS